jgi:pimeloyl-[acyl-carrier protein] methyl ester esterase
MTTLVLLPGMDGTGELFGPLIAALRPRFNVTVVRYPASVPLDYEDLVDLARAELPGEDEFVIVGESFSGPVAVSLAAQAPPNLRGLVLCASFVRCPVPWAARLKPVTPLLPFGAIPASVLAVPLLGRYGNPPARRLLAGALAKVHAKVLRARIRSVLTVDVRQKAAAIKVPFLYLQASADWIVPKSAAMQIRALVPALEVIELSGPHMLLQISPTAAARAIEAFVDMTLLRKPRAQKES